MGVVGNTSPSWKVPGCVAFKVPVGFCHDLGFRVFGWVLGLRFLFGFFRVCRV